MTKANGSRRAAHEAGLPVTPVFVREGEDPDRAASLALRPRQVPGGDEQPEKADQDADVEQDDRPRKGIDLGWRRLILEDGPGLALHVPTLRSPANGGNARIVSPSVIRNTARAERRHQPPDPSDKSGPAADEGREAVRGTRDDHRSRPAMPVLHTLHRGAA